MHEGKVRRKECRVKSNKKKKEEENVRRKSKRKRMQSEKETRQEYVQGKVKWRKGEERNEAIMMSKEKFKNKRTKNKTKKKS